MQKIMTHGVKHYNITFYQETLLQYYGKTFCIVVTVFNKKIKKRNIIMQFSVLGNNNYTINEQEHNTDKNFPSLEASETNKKDYLFYSMLPKNILKKTVKIYLN